MGRFNLTREFFIPKGARKVAHKHSDAVAYVYEANGHPCARVFYGKQAKPVAAYRYRNEAEREQSVAKYFAARVEHDHAMAQRREARKGDHGLKAGDVLVSSWGYDQTNVDFYKVLRLVGSQSVEIVKVGGKHSSNDGGSSMSGRVSADPDKIIGDPMLRRARPGGHVTIEGNYRHASPWDGKPHYESWYA